MLLDTPPGVQLPCVPRAASRALSAAAEGAPARRARPHAFKAVFTVSLHGELLRTDLRVHNTGDTPFDFTAALHTYIEVLDIGVAKVRGLQGLRYLDKARPCLPLFAVNDMGRAAPATRRERRCARAQVQDAANPPEATEERTEVGFEGPVDSVYLGAKDYVELDVGTGAAVAIASSGWEDVVVVRPGCCLRFTVGAPMGRGCGLMDFGFANPTLHLRGAVEPLDRNGGVLQELLLRGERQVWLARDRGAGRGVDGHAGVCRDRPGVRRRGGVAPRRACCARPGSGVHDYLGPEAAPAPGLCCLRGRASRQGWALAAWTDPPREHAVPLESVVLQRPMHAPCEHAGFCILVPPTCLPHCST